MESTGSHSGKSCPFDRVATDVRDGTGLKEEGANVWVSRGFQREYNRTSLPATEPWSWIDLNDRLFAAQALSRVGPPLRLGDRYAGEKTEE